MLYPHLSSVTLYNKYRPKQNNMKRYMYSCVVTQVLDIF